MTTTNFEPGTECTVNAERDNLINGEVRSFVGTECKIVRKTKAGLIMVEKVSDPKQVVSVAQYNVTLKSDADYEQVVAIFKGRYL